MISRKDKVQPLLCLRLYLWYFKESSLLLRTPLARDLHLTSVKWEGSLTSMSNFQCKLHFHLTATSFPELAQAQILDMWFETDCSDCVVEFTICQHWMQGKKKVSYFDCFMEYFIFNSTLFENSRCWKSLECSCSFQLHTALILLAAALLLLFPLQNVTAKNADWKSEPQPKHRSYKTEITWSFVFSKSSVVCVILQVWRNYVRDCPCDVWIPRDGNTSLEQAKPWWPPRGFQVLILPYWLRSEWAVSLF